jgi:hypothetical protein
MVSSALGFCPGGVEVLEKQITISTLHALQAGLDHTKMPISAATALVWSELMPISLEGLFCPDSSGNLAVILFQILSVTSCTGCAPHSILIKESQPQVYSCHVRKILADVGNSKI